MKNFIGSRPIPRMHYHRPRELKTALHMLRELQETCELIAGGTDLLPALRRGTAPLGFKHIVDLSGIQELNYIVKKENGIRIGALTHLAAIEESEVVKQHAPVLAEAIGQMGSLQIRNQGTIGGNLCNASPAADTVPPLLILRAKVLLRNAGRKRIVPLGQFFSGPGKTVLAPDEMLVEIQFPVPEAEGRFCHLKLGRRNAFTLSIVSVAAWVKAEKETFEGIRVALGAVAPTSIRASRTEKFLLGRKVSTENIDRGAKMVTDEIQPISDVRASAEYRKDMSYVLTKKAILSCLTPDPPSQG